MNLARQSEIINPKPSGYQAPRTIKEPEEREMRRICHCLLAYQQQAAPSAKINRDIIRLNASAIVNGGPAPMLANARVRRRLIIHRRNSTQPRRCGEKETSLKSIKELYESVESVKYLERMRDSLVAVAGNTQRSDNILRYL